MTPEGQAGPSPWTTRGVISPPHTIGGQKGTQMPQDILHPLAVASRSAAANVPFALAVMAVLAFGTWLAQRSSTTHTEDSRRAAFLRQLASQPKAISAEVYAAYAADPEWRARALREIVDPALDDEMRSAIRQALAAA